MSKPFTRREAIAWSATAAFAGALRPGRLLAATERSSGEAGAVVGDGVGAKIGEQILRDGGNAIDAAIAAAFAACIASPAKCGIGGYGGHAMIALAGGKKITAIDFNSTAPSATRPDIYPLDANGRVKGGVNVTGWLAAGVPGTLAGLELALQRYGTRSLRDTLAPAIQLCEDSRYSSAIKGIDAPAESGSQRMRALATLLKTFSTRNSTDSFYRGDIADTVASAFQKNSGLVTRADLAAYRAREVSPLTLEWNGATVHTVPLTSTGPLLLEAFSILKMLGWEKLTADERLHAKVEALRIAWADRLEHFGDPSSVQVPLEKLLSPAYASERGAAVFAALAEQKPLPMKVSPSHAGGTTNISAADRRGNLIAITLTHGGSYGARVAVPELGLILGHGMSRFDPRPGFPNSPGPGKRPITNMCPTIVTQDNTAVFAVGAAGGTRIPNALYEILLNHVGLRTTLEAAMSAPRVDANGTTHLGLERSHSNEDEAFFQRRGYQTSRVSSAYAGAVTFDPVTGDTRGLATGGA